MHDVKITVTENGPLSVKGPITLVDQDGNEYDVGGRKRVALCRCGGSTTKPFCDGTHSRISFQAAERAVAASSSRSTSRSLIGIGATIRIAFSPLRTQ